MKNFRNVQALNGREVSFYSSIKKVVEPMERAPVPEVKNTGDEEPVVEEDPPSKIFFHFTTAKICFQKILYNFANPSSRITNY